MKNKIKKGIKILKEEGVGAFTSRTINFFKVVIRSATDRFLLRNKKRIITRLKNFQSDDRKEVFSFIAKSFFGAFAPMQIKDFRQTGAGIGVLFV